MKKFIAIISIISLLAGCKKATTDTTAPVITISTPTEGQDFMQMGSAVDSITINANISDADLHAYSIVVARTDGSDTLLYIPETHQEINNLSITKKFAYHVVTGTASYVITIDAQDHSG